MIAIVLMLSGVLAFQDAGAGNGELSNTWQQFSPLQRYDALQHYRRHERQSEKRKRKIEQEYRRWRTLPQRERERIRRNYELYRQLPPAEQERFQHKYKLWKKRRREKSD